MIPLPFTDEIDAEQAKIFRQLTESESVKNTAMWVGSHVCEPQNVFVISSSASAFEQRALMFPPSIIQVLMEQIANMLDQRNEHPAETTQFRISFNKETGEASVLNNGKSIPVVKVPDRNGTPTWLPQLLCNGFLSGSNHDKTKGSKRISLGAHGIGLKALTSMSTRMQVECVDLERGVYYSQHINKCNTEVCAPSIIALDGKKNKPPTELKTGGTRFTYTIDYSHYQELPADIFATMDAIFRARIYQLAGYSGVATWYNEEKVPIKTPKALAEMYFPRDMYFFEISHAEHSSWPLGIAIAPTREVTDEKGKVKHIAERISIINGGFIGAGIHFDYIADRIADDLRARVEKMLKGNVKWRKDRVTSNLSIAIIGTLPDLIFDAQIKNTLNMRGHKEYFAQFTWPDKYIDHAWKIVRAALGDQYIVEKGAKNKRERKLANPEKYTPAEYLGVPQSNLLLFEGDSAQSAAITAMADQTITFKHDYHGIFLLGGCPINARKHMTTTKHAGREITKPDKMLTDNVVWNDFMTVMGLQYGAKYDTPEARASLKYHHITLVVDKDLHGMGKIGAIMLSNIILFWPELLYVSGFIGYFDSPLIRAYPRDPRKSRVLEFGSQDEFEKWRNSVFPNGIVPENEWDIKWIKGLAGHSDEESIYMFGRFDKLRIVFSDSDTCAIEKLSAYFGRDTSLRKEYLSSPVNPIPFVENRRAIDVSTYCDYYVKEEQQYNIICKLNGIYDNLIHSHRKIIWGAIHYMHSAKRNAPIKVYQLAGHIAEETAYHHGNDSINNSIVWLAQDFVGARNIPHLMPLNQMGTRFSPDDAGAPRYVDTQANTIVDALYPPEDRELYELLMEDGVETTPRHMVPVVCMPIIETNSLPGTGWAISKLARDYHEHVANIYRMMEGLPPLKMRAWTPGWRGEIVEINGVEWSAGKCSYDAATRIVRITELPYQIKVLPYINGKKKKAKDDDEDDHKRSFCLRECPLIETKTIRNYSSKTQIDISFKLEEGAIDKINASHGSEYFDPLTEYLGLKEHMGAMLNFIDDDGTVQSFSTYEGAMVPWFIERYKLYGLRFARRIIIIDLTIEMLQNQVRYIGERSKLGVSGKKRARQIEILEEAKFARFNATKLKHPGNVPNEMIRGLVLGGIGDAPDEDDEEGKPKGTSGASFAYLLRTTDAGSSEERVAKLIADIEKLRAERSELSSGDITHKVWRREIEEVTRFIDAALKDGWVKKGKYKYA